MWNVADIKVEVAYALPRQQVIIELDVPEGTNMLDAAKLSGVAQRFPEIDLDAAAMGIFGKTERKPQERLLKPGDRVEIYRPLLADPKEVRKRRAAEAKGGST